MNELHILDTGRGDCTVCLFDGAQGRYCAVVDGGRTEYRGRRVLLDFLRERKIDAIDLLILTHVHMDHFGGMCFLDEGIKVRQVVAPCGDMVFSQRIVEEHQEDELWIEYHRAFSYLEKTAESMLTSKEASGRSFWFNECRMQCIYPLPDTPMTATRAIQAVAKGGLTEEEEDVLYAQYKKVCNADSSIWTIHCAERQIALLAGDSTEDAMSQALRAYPFRPEVLKLSHHGINLNYFSARQIAEIDPQIVVVSNDRELAEQVEPECGALGAKELRYTWDGSFCYPF